MNALEAHLLFQSMQGLGDSLEKRREFDAMLATRAAQGKANAEYRARSLDLRDRKEQDAVAAGKAKEGDKVYDQTMQTFKVDDARRAAIINQKEPNDGTLDMNAAKIAADLELRRRGLEDKENQPEKGAAVSSEYFDPQTGITTKVKGTPEQHDQFLQDFQAKRGYALTSPPAKQEHVDRPITLKLHKEDGSEVEQRMSPKEYQDFTKRQMADFSSSAASAGAQGSSGAPNAVAAPVAPAPAVAATPTPQAPTSSSYKIGATYNHPSLGKLKYLGGDPNQQAAWQIQH